MNVRYREFVMLSLSIGTGNDNSLRVRLRKTQQNDLHFHSGRLYMHKISRVCLSLSIGCKKDATEYMLIIYLLRVIDENEESIYDFDSGIYMNHKISRVCLSLNLCRAIVVS